MIMLNLAVLISAAVLAGAQGDTAADAASPAQSCEKVQAEMVALKAEMRQIGSQSVRSSATQGKVQEVTSYGAVAAQALATVVPVASLASEGLGKLQHATADRALDKAQQRTANAIQISRRIQELQKLSASTCGNEDGKGQ